MDRIRVTNYNMAVARLIAMVLFTPLLGFIAYALLSHEWTAAIPVIAGFIGLLGAIAFLAMGLRVVFYFELGDELIVRRLFGRTTHSLDEIAEVDAETVAAKAKGVTVARNRILRLRMRDGKVHELKVSPEEEKAVCRRLADSGVDGLEPAPAE